MGEMRACNFAKAVNPTAERATGRQAGIIYLRLPRGWRNSGRRRSGNAVHSQRTISYRLLVAVTGFERKLRMSKFLVQLKL